jgi:hypothetical protein
MKPSYSSYKNDINSFNIEEYIKNLSDSTSYNIFYNFIDNYKEIENEDFKKPIFSQTSKFKKIPGNYKNYKYLKINRDDEEKNTWIFENPTNEIEKISILIKTYLNKISQDTYKKVSLDFMNDLILIENYDLFEILSSEILNKCLFDNKYRNLYINLCFRIWTNKQIHYNFTNIVNKEGNYFWKYKNNESLLEGPFLTENNAKLDIFNKLSFKKYFLNYIQKLYINKDLVYSNLSDEDIFIKKKKFLLLVELIGIIFLEKYINFDIINLIIIDLLHISKNKFKHIEEIEYEALYNLIKLMHDNNTITLLEYKNIFEEYVNIIKSIIENNDISKRSMFFLNDIITMLRKINNVKDDQKVNVSNKNNKDSKELVIEYIKNNNLIEAFSIYNGSSVKENILYKLIENYLENMKKHENIVEFIIKLNNPDMINIIIQKMLDNISDIIIDIPDISKRILILLNNINYDHPNKEILIEKINNIENDSDEDTCEDSDEDTCEDSE